jgi:hypothetical protein
MVTIAQVSDALRATLHTAATEAARPSGFTQRRSKLSAAVFVQTLVWGWLADPAASVAALAQTAAAAGVRLTPQGLHQRFTQAGAALLRAVLTAVVEEALEAEPVALPLLARFTAVRVRDSTTIALPDALATEWPGCGGRVATGSAAALKLQVELDLRRGRLDGPWLQAGRAQDRTSPHQESPRVAGALELADRMYFTLGLAQAVEAAGAYYLFRLHPQLAVFTPDGERWDVPAWRPRGPPSTSRCTWASPPGCPPGCWRRGSHPRWPSGGAASCGRPRGARGGSRPAWPWRWSAGMCTSPTSPPAC